MNPLANVPLFLCASNATSSEGMDEQALASLSEQERRRYRHVDFLARLEDSSEEDTDWGDRQDRCKLYRTLRQLAKREDFSETVTRIHDTGHYSLRRFPRLVREFRALTCLQLEDYWSCAELPDCFDELPQLRRLALFTWPRLTSLPPSIVTLRHLEQLCVGHTGISALPDRLSDLTTLVTLFLPNNQHLRALPHGFHRFTRLQRLCLAECSALTELPSDLGKMTDLLWLEIDRCVNLRLIPESILELRGLRKVTLRGCSGLVFIPARLIVGLPYAKVTIDTWPKRAPIRTASRILEVDDRDENHQLVEVVYNRVVDNQVVHPHERRALRSEVARRLHQDVHRRRYRGLRTEIDLLERVDRAIGRDVCIENPHEEQPRLLTLMLRAVLLEHTRLLARRERLALMNLDTPGIDHQLSSEAQRAAADFSAGQ